MMVQHLCILPCRTPHTAQPHLNLKYGSRQSLKNRAVESSSCRRSSLCRTDPQSSSDIQVLQKCRAGCCYCTLAVNSFPANLRCASNLSQVLKAEIEEERPVEFDKDVASMVKDVGKKEITVKDEPGVSSVRLFRPGVGDEKVTVEFDCDVKGDGDDGWEDDLEDFDVSLEWPDRQQAGEEDMADPGYRFTAKITKGAKMMALTGTATDTIAVQEIRVNAANVEWGSS